MSPSAPLGLGIVGVGTISVRGILPHLAVPDVHDRVRVRALCDPVPGRASAAAAQYDVPAAYLELEELLADDAVDAVSIASPIGLHSAQVRRALECGKHVHVNKTLCTTVAEADELIALAESRGLRLVASPGEILRPQVRAIRETIERGDLGRVCWAVTGSGVGTYHEAGEPERLNAPGGAPIDPGWYFRRPGGGPLYDVTVYYLHGLTSVLGPAQAVTAMSGVRIRERSWLGRRVEIDADDSTTMLLDFGDGLVVVAYGTAAGATSEEFGATVYHGTEGVLDGIELNGRQIDFDGRDLTTHAPRTDWDAQVSNLPHVTGAHRGMPEAHVFEDIMQLVDLVLDDVPTPVTAEQARHVVDIIESAYRAAETGQTQRLRTTFSLPSLPDRARAATAGG